MRGRTNIPPRIGGLVNGVVTKCTVAEAGGIAVGDYVQLVENTGVVSDNDLYILNEWIYGPFILSDGEVAEFYVTTGGEVKVRRTKVGYSGFEGTPIVTNLTVPEVGSIFPTSRNYELMYCLELAMDKFLVILTSSEYSSQPFYLLVTYEDSEWNVANLSVSNPYSSNLNNAEFCKISESKIAILYSYSTTLAIIIADISASAITLGESIPISFSSTAQTLFAEFINGYLLVSRDGELVSFLPSGLSITEIDRYDIGKNAERWNVCKLGDDKLIVFYGSSSDGDLDYATTPNGYLYATLISLDALGHISVSEDQEAIYYNITGNTLSGRLNQACPYVFADNRIMAISALVERSRNSPYTYSVAETLAVVGAYAKGSNELNFDELEKFNSLQVSSSNTYGERQLFLRPIEVEEGLLYFVVGGCTQYDSGGAYYTYIIKQYVTRVAQTEIIGLSELPIVKKYVNRINGIAKTAGMNGSTIEVYSPSSLV